MGIRGALRDNRWGGRLARSRGNVGAQESQPGSEGRRIVRRVRTFSPRALGAQLVATSLVAPLPGWTKFRLAPTRRPRLDGRLLRRALPPELLEEPKLRKPRAPVVLIPVPVPVPVLVLVFVFVLAIALVFPWVVLVARADGVANVVDVAHLRCVALVLKVVAATNVLKVAATAAASALSIGGVVSTARAV
ncbi:hypothetical protein PSCLAVI8L_470027 [Pseudoclavibacter sp. 8L]|nr:hypothetical protein PSCLAVI8L_470027 [Pseudoclavibacter sp. 8L]